MPTTALFYPTADATRVAGWATPEKAYDQFIDDVFAICPSTSVGAQQDYFTFTGLYEAIPVGATILGIEVLLEGMVGGEFTLNGDNGTISIALSKNAGSSFTAEKANTYYILNGQEDLTYGGISDLWGTTWTKEDFNTSNFRLYMEATSEVGGVDDFYADHLRVRVTYQPAPGGGTMAMMGV